MLIVPTPFLYVEIASLGTGCTIKCKNYETHIITVVPNLVCALHGRQSVKSFTNPEIRHFYLKIFVQECNLINIFGSK